MLERFEVLGHVLHQGTVAGDHVIAGEHDGAGAVAEVIRAVPGSVERHDSHRTDPDLVAVGQHPIRPQSGPGLESHHRHPERRRQRMCRRGVIGMGVGDRHTDDVERVGGLQHRPDVGIDLRARIDDQSLAVRSPAPRCWYRPR